MERRHDHGALTLDSAIGEDKKYVVSDTLEN
jgi:hypothetical protein